MRLCELSSNVLPSASQGLSGVSSGKRINKPSQQEKQGVIPVRPEPDFPSSRPASPGRSCGPVIGISVPLFPQDAKGS